MNTTKQQVTYRDAGVDVDEGARAVELIKESVATTRRPEVIGGLGGFGGLLLGRAAIKAMADPVLVSGTDGVGTKLKLAQLFDRHDTVGIDLVAMCVNDLLASGAEPLFFLDYIAIGHIDAEHVAEHRGVASRKGCRQSGCALMGGETAEHPGVMARGRLRPRPAFCVGAVDRPEDDPARDGARRATWCLVSQVRAACTPTAIRSPGASSSTRATIEEYLRAYGRARRRVPWPMPCSSLRAST